MRGIDGKYHLVYKTTCIVNDKFYIGKHSTRVLEDGYLGSGKQLRYSIKKYGKENFKREILFYCNSSVEANLKEKEIVNENLINNALCMNIALGGGAGWAYANSVFTSSEYVTSGRCATTALKNLAQRTPDDLSRASKNAWKRKYEIMKAASHIGLLAMATNSAIKKRKATFAERGHMQGEKNSQFGTCWVTDGVKPVKIKKEQLSEYLEKGYSRGRNCALKADYDGNR